MTDREKSEPGFLERWSRKKIDAEREANRRQTASESPEQLVVASTSADRPPERRVIDIEHSARVVADVSHQAEIEQISQSGDLGRQTVAPRSISAWAQSPGRSAVTSDAARSFSSGLASGTGGSTANSRAITR